MNDDLVQLTTQDVSKAIPVTTSEIVAEQYQVKHRSITDLIVRYESDFREFGELMRFEIAPVSSQRATTGFYLTEEQFYLLVTYMKNTEIARKAKIQLVKAFSFAKKELIARIDTRKIGKVIRVSLTDSIKDHINPEGNFKKFAYSNYTKLVYKRVLGMDVKKAKELRNVPEDGNLRNYLTIAELEQVQDLESKIATFIEMTDTAGKNDKQIYQLVKDWIDKPKQIA
jgi:phage regulator Rha-like protein